MAKISTRNAKAAMDEARLENGQKEVKMVCSEKAVQPLKERDREKKRKRESGSNSGVSERCVVFLYLLYKK